MPSWFEVAMSFLRSGVRVSLVFNFVCLLYRSQKLLAQHFSIKRKYLMVDNKEHMICPTPFPCYYQRVVKNKV